ncbi:hypothetical protein F2P56_031045 [Juglans regia]|uniref:Uncharacterized protein n=2 Tax=Juglans regia TaxID=51240 RepID=A0A833U622_JUGRE|nr:uncharacterized protein At4g08330, chloroplastic-like [Juglans regia]KAF5450718.1 hypothetical protein F2P56_031045 [Juglans regia]
MEEKSVSVKERYLNGHQHHGSFSSSSCLSSSRRDISYSCGSCGYELNLSSGDRNTSSIDSKYGKSIKKGIISFFYIDESRFTQMDEIQCIPHFSKYSLGLIRRRTKLLCRKCGNPIGIAYNDRSSHPIVSDGNDSSSGNEVSSRRKYDVKIRALQPSSSEVSGIPFSP